MSCIKQNFAFISYNHKDVKWAKWLRRRLEWYRLPAEIHNEFEDSRYIRPVFRDRDELNSGILNDELRSRLKASKYLIVICSPNAVKSQWVSDEVQAFIEMGRLEYIIPFIVDGDEGSFPAPLKKWNAENPKCNLLGIAVTDDGKKNRQKAFVRLVSRMLDVEFDTLWRRHRREVRMVASALSAIALLSLFVAYWFMIPVRLTVSLQDCKATLPKMEKGILYVNGSEYELANPDTAIMIQPQPGYLRLHTIEIGFIADRFYDTINREIRVTAGLFQEETIALQRDSSYAIYAGVVMDVDGNLLPDVSVVIENQLATTDDEGHFSLHFSLEEQTETKVIALSKDGYETLMREDECPSKHLKYILKKQ